MHKGLAIFRKAIFSSPILYDLSSLASSYSDLDNATTTYSVNFVFRTDGTIDVLRNIDPDLLDEEVYVIPASEAANLWVRATEISGSGFTHGDTPAVWLQLNVERNFEMRYTSAGGSDDITGVVRFELSRNSAGTDIVATSADITVTVGEIF